MSRLDYSKWDNIELSDDEDVECHPNIDKASWIRWRQQDIHQKREERKMKIAGLKQEHSTNEELKRLMLDAIEKFKVAGEGEKLAADILGRVQKYEKERKAKIFDPESDEYLKPNGVSEVFDMLVSRLCTEGKVEQTAADYYAKLPKILVDEIPKLEKRQKEVLETIKTEEHEQSKKLTSENIGQEGFSKTIINPKKAATASSTSSQKSTSGKKESTVEVLNPGYENVRKEPAAAANEVDLRELSLHEEKMLLNFAKIETFEDSYKFIQSNPEVVSRAFSDHLMARAFKMESEGKPKAARLCAKWSLALSYAMQMGKDGVGLFYKRLISGGPQPQQVFEVDVESTYTRIKERTKVLKEKEKDITSENSNLTPEQAEAFKSFPKFFQDALFANDIEKINEAFEKMGQEQAAEVMEKCQATGLISVLSEEEAEKFREQSAAEEETKKTE